MKKETVKKIYIAISVVVFGLFIISITKNVFEKNLSEYENLDEFAKCLTDKNIVEYGNWWCEACKKQKELFGKSFKYVKYIECSKNTQECVNKNIEYTPTWIFPNGEKIIGLTPLEILSEQSKCALNK